MPFCSCGRWTEKLGGCEQCAPPSAEKFRCRLIETEGKYHPLVPNSPWLEEEERNVRSRLKGETKKR